MQEHDQEHKQELKQRHEKKYAKKNAPLLNTEGYDPEMLFVECAKCGNPIVWEEGRSTEILRGAGIDPLELDAQCLLVTDGCPRCSCGKMYHVQIYRVQSNLEGMNGVKRAGNA